MIVINSNFHYSEYQEFGIFKVKPMLLLFERIEINCNVQEISSLSLSII